MKCLIFFGITSMEEDTSAHVAVNFMGGLGL